MTILDIDKNKFTAFQREIIDYFNKQLKYVDWHTLEYPDAESSILCFMFYNENLSDRSIQISLSDVERYRVSGFFKNTGINYEIRLLQIIISMEDEVIYPLWDLYCNWIIKKESEAIVDEILEKYMDKFNNRL